MVVVYFVKSLLIRISELVTKFSEIFFLSNIDKQPEVPNSFFQHKNQYFYIFFVHLYNF